jgi:hypothetical protein
MKIYKIILFTCLVLLIKPVIWVGQMCDDKGPLVGQQPSYVILSGLNTIYSFDHRELKNPPTVYTYSKGEDLQESFIVDSGIEKLQKLAKPGKYTLTGNHGFFCLTGMLNEPNDLLNYEEEMIKLHNQSIYHGQQNPGQPQQGSQTTQIPTSPQYQTYSSTPSLTTPQYTQNQNGQYDLNTPSLTFQNTLNPSPQYTLNQASQYPISTQGPTTQLGQYQNSQYPINTQSSTAQLGQYSASSNQIIQGSTNSPTGQSSQTTVPQHNSDSSMLSNANQVNSLNQRISQKKKMKAKK